MPRKYGSSTAVKRSVSQDSKGEATKEIIASLIRELFKRYDRCERAFQLAIMEMVVNGVSTRKVSHIVEELCVNILVRGNRSSGKSETDSPEHWKPPNVSLLA